jgi:hypothetical protein
MHESCINYRGKTRGSCRRKARKAWWDYKAIRAFLSYAPFLLEFLIVDRVHFYPSL